MLILLGSSVGMMEKIGLSRESPLYGRATRIIKLKGLGYRSARAFTEKYSEEDKIRTYAVFGDTPGYLALLDDTKTLTQNIENLVLKPGAPLRDEPTILLSMELREPSRYMQILEAIAVGATKLGEIAGKASIKTSEAGKYLRVLEKHLDLIERRYPLLQEGKRGKARYYIKDNFFKFWFRHILPNTGLLELGLHRQVLENIEKTIDEYTSHIFEQVALQHLALLAKNREITFTNIGKWWHKDVEIDLVAIDKKTRTAYFIEAKWSKNPLTRKTLYRLISKSEKFPWRKNDRKNIYILYSRKGYTFTTDDENVKLYTLKHIEKTFNQHKPQTKPPP